MPSNTCSRVVVRATISQVRERDLFAARAVEDDVLHALGQLLERPIDVEADVLRKALQHLEIKLVAPVPALDRAGRDDSMRKCDDALRIEEC